jgi:hypothetical protein
MPNKNFRCSEESIRKYDELKKKEKITVDADFFQKMLYYTEKFLNSRVVDIELLNQKEKENQRLLLKIGELQGELNIYKQQALPKKSEKKWWWQIWK